MKKKGKNTSADQLTLFSLMENTSPGRKINVVETDVLSVRRMDYQELFGGFEELYAITYSTSVDFICELLPHFQYAEIIFGFEGILPDDIATIMGIQFSQLSFLSQHSSAHMLLERMKEGSLRLYISRRTKSHEKMYVLKTGDEKHRVIEGSANLSYAAFTGKQRKNITLMEGEKAFHYYYPMFLQFRDECSDHVSYQAMTQLSDHPNLATEAPIEMFPIYKTLQAKQTILIEHEPESEDQMIISMAKDITKDLVPLFPKPRMDGTTYYLTTQDLVKATKPYREIREQKKQEKGKLPQLHIDLSHRRMWFQGKECCLTPEKGSVRRDISNLLFYMDGFADFTGDTGKTQRKYFLLANWLFCSPFMPYLRQVAYRNGQNVLFFPVFAIIYGNSNGGKTEFVRLVKKMMCGRNIPVNRSQDFTTTRIDALKQKSEGLPILIDDLDRSQYNNHADKIIKYDEWGLREGLLTYPSVVITTNKVPSVTADLSKRVCVFHIEACIDKETAFRNFSKIQKYREEIKNDFYCEYVKRMMDVVEAMGEKMKSSNHEYIPDIFSESSKIVVDIMKEVVDLPLPEYVSSCDYRDYLGDKVVGENAIAKIQRAYQFEPGAFHVSKKTNTLVYEVPEDAYYEPVYLANELPPSLGARRINRTLVMDLAKAEDFFELNFRKKGLFERLHQAKRNTK